MIKHDDFLEKLTSPDLTEEEKLILSLLENLTDECIQKQYPLRRMISLEDSAVEKLLSPLGRHRKDVVTGAWKERYRKEGGWGIRFYSDGRYSEWIVEPLAK